MKSNTKNLVYSALFLAIGLILPSIFHAFGIGAGTIFLPMHIPVLLAGLFLGGKYGLMIGAVLPILSSFVSGGMPPLYPVAISMSFELLTYGFMTGYLYKGKKLNIYLSLILAMIAGRFISGIVNAILLGLFGNGFSLSVFLTGAFITALPGIIIQIIFVPVIVKVCEKFLIKDTLNI